MGRRIMLVGSDQGPAMNAFYEHLRDSFRGAQPDQVGRHVESTDVLGCGAQEREARIAAGHHQRQVIAP